MEISQQIQYLFILAIPISCISWTITREALFKEPRAFCTMKSKECRSVLERKFFYLFTCEYCFSHYITLFFVFITKYYLLLTDWRGYLIGFFALVWIANVYMSLYGFIRVGMKKEKMDADIEELRLQLEKTKCFPSENA